MMLTEIYNPPRTAVSALAAVFIAGVLLFMPPVSVAQDSREVQPAAPIPTVSITSFVIASSTSVSADASITNFGSLTNGITGRGFYFGNDPDPVNNGSEFGPSLSISSIFTRTFAGLMQGNTYYVVAFVRTPDGEGRSSVMSIDLDPLPTVTTDNATIPSSTSGTMNGTITNILDIANVTAHGFYFGTDPDPINNGAEQAGNPLSGGNFDLTMMGLTKGTTYYYAAFARTSAGEGQGSIKSFTPVDAVTLEVDDAEILSSTSAALTGRITNLADTGGIISRGFYWGTDPDPINNGTKVGPALSINNVFTQTLTGLTPGTTYFFASFAENARGESQSIIKSFTVPIPRTVTVLAAANGNTDKDGANVVLSGNDFTVTATADAGYNFGSWSGDASGTNPVLTITNVQSDLTIQPNFVRETGNLTVSIIDNPGSGQFTISGPADFNGGTDFTGTSFSQDVPSGPYTVTYDLVVGSSLSVTSSQLTVNPFNQAAGNVNDSDTVTVTGTYLTETGALNVNIVDAPAGGAFTISGPANFNGGSPLTNQTTSFNGNVPVGNYTVVFTTADGLTPTVTASSFTVTGTTATGAIASGGTETVTGTYPAIGSLRVNILPAGAAQAGAGWRLLGDDDDPIRFSGDVKQFVSPGQVTVTFTDVDGFNTPANQTVTIEAGKLTTLTVIYGTGDDAGEGGTVIITQSDGNAPPEAGWRPVSGSSAADAIGPSGHDNPFFSFGESVGNLPIGDLTIQFREVPGYITPANIDITVRADRTVTMNVTYIRPFHAGPNDYDGDGRTDLAVFNADSGTWSTATVARNNGGLRKDRPLTDVAFGPAGIVPTPGDYDGDQISDTAGFNPADGSWIVDSQFNIKRFGDTGDMPVPADYDGDGITDAALYSPETGRWTMMLSSEGRVATLVWGDDRYLPQPGDFNGDGFTDLGIYRQSNGTWKVLMFDPDRGTFSKKRKLGRLGETGDIPVAGDYDGDGRSEMAVYRPSTGTFILASGEEITIGKPGMTPVPADWTGDGTTNPAVFSERNGRWLIRVGNKTFKTKFGAGSKPLNVQH